MEVTAIEKKGIKMPLEIWAGSDRIWKHFLSSKNIMTKDMKIALTGYYTNRRVEMCVSGEIFTVDLMRCPS